MGHFGSQSTQLDWNKIDGDFRHKVTNYIARRVGNRQEAEDLFQELLINVWKKGERIRPESAGSYIFKSASNSAASRGRGMKRLHDNGFDVTSLDVLIDDESKYRGPISWNDNPEALWIGKEERGEMLKKIEEYLRPLSGSERQVWMRYEGEDAMSIPEIAATLGISEDSVYQRLCRARKKLRKQKEEINGLKR